MRLSIRPSETKIWSTFRSVLLEFKGVRETDVQQKNGPTFYVLCYCSQREFSVLWLTMWQSNDTVPSGVCSIRHIFHFRGFRMGKFLQLSRVRDRLWYFRQRKVKRKPFGKRKLATGNTLHVTLISSRRRGNKPLMTIQPYNSAS